MIQGKAFAKLNISLDVTNVREDGFHNMLMVMQSVSLCDDISITVNGSGTVSSSCNFSYIPCDDKNLAVKAAKLLLDATGNAGTGAEISIVKNIPVGAGLAGGSADAAAVLRLLNVELGSPLDRDELLSLAEKVGSDVPYCTLCGTAIAEGRGELLTPIRDFPACRFLICKPVFSISTPELFSSLDRVKLRRHPDTKGIVAAIEEQDINGVCRRMYNVFEDVSDRRMRTIQEIKCRILAGGALGSIMTGTGSAVFGVFPENAELEPLRASLEKSYGFCAEAVPVGAQI